MYYSLNKRERKRLLTNELKQYRLPHEPTWMETADLALPFRIRLNLTDYNRSDGKNSRIYNNTATRALKTFQSGLMTAATDPTSDWVTMTTKDPDRAEYGPHRQWLDDVMFLILQDIADSNVYQTLPVAYGSEATFGFFALGLEESYKRAAVHSRLFPTGSCWFGEDDEGSPHTFYREYRATVRQLYMRFGERGEFSQHVQHLIDRGDWEQWVDVGHLIEPNDDYRESNPFWRYKKYSSCWYELGSSSKATGYGGQAVEGETYLEEGGFDMFPVLIGRWEKVEGEVYPTDYPGSECLGDNKSLQIGEKRVAQAIEKFVNPHWIAPAGMRGLLDKGFLPGDTSYVDERNEGKSVRPAHVLDPRGIQFIREHLADVKQRILESFHYPTFSTFDALPDKQRTATEILERKSEKLLKLVDMYANLQIGVLRPMIDFFYEVRRRRGMLPPPPQDLQNQALDYRFNGILAQAQKLNRVQPIQAVGTWVAEIAKVQSAVGYPEVMDKFDMDQAVDEVATNYNCPASVIRDDKVVAARREERAKAQQAAQQIQMLEQASQTAKNLGQTPMDDDNALGALVGR